MNFRGLLSFFSGRYWRQLFLRSPGGVVATDSASSLPLVVRWRFRFWRSRSVHWFVGLALAQIVLRGMPLNLILVRHGQSEGNLAQDLFRISEVDRELLQIFAQRHGSEYRLTTRGCRQARLAGAWLRDHIVKAPFGGKVKAHSFFHVLYTSTHIRAKETAAQLAQELGAAQRVWHFDALIRERDYGQYEFLTESNLAGFLPVREALKTRPLHHTPVGVEGSTAVLSRLWITLSNLCRNYSLANVIFVCHGDIIWHYRYLLERMEDSVFSSKYGSPPPAERMLNGCVVHYTRVHPLTGKVSPWFSHMRIVFPDHPEGELLWRAIDRPLITAEELMREAQSIPRLVDNADNSR